jgi:hypothetical protein
MFFPIPSGFAIGIQKHQKEMVCDAQTCWQEVSGAADWRILPKMQRISCKNPELCDVLSARD